jgi:hypothetical protein
VADHDCEGYWFDLGEIRRDLPVHLWYGRHDGSVLGEAIAVAIIANAKLYVRDEAHLSMIAGREKRS